MDLGSCMGLQARVKQADDTTSNIYNSHQARMSNDAGQRHLAGVSHTTHLRSICGMTASRVA